MKYPFCLGAAAFLVASVAGAQDFPAAKPESVGLSSERLSRIAATVQRDIDDKKIAGMVTLVIRHGQVAWFDAQGHGRPRGGQADAEGLDLPDLLHDETDNEHGGHDAVRGGEIPS